MKSVASQDQKGYWCPYTGEEHRLNSGSREHVIPLSLGGMNSFCVMANKEKQVALGTRLDQPFGNLFPVDLVARRHKFRSHHRVERRVRWKAEEAGGSVGELDLSKDVPVFSVRRSKNRMGMNANLIAHSDMMFSSTFRYDEHFLLSFGAKLALAGGAYFFGSTFREAGHHDSLRELMNSDEAVKVLRNMAFRKMNSTADLEAPFHGIGFPKSLRCRSMPDLLWVNALNGHHGKSFMWTHHTPQEVLMCVCLYGYFDWYFTIAKQPSAFSSALEDGEIGKVLELDHEKRTHSEFGLRQYLKTRVQWIK